MMYIFFRRQLLRCFLFSALILIISVTTANTREDRIKVGVQHNPPLIFKDKDGQYKGLSIDIIEYVASEEGWRLEYVFCNWPECLEKLHAGETDIQVVIAYSEKRAKKYDFTNETLFNNWGQIYSQPGSGIENILDLKGKSVGLINKAIHPTAFRELAENFGIEIKFIELEDYTSLLRLIHEKKADAIVINRTAGERLAKDYNVVKTSIIFNPIEIRYATPKGKNGDLRAAIDRHLASLKKVDNSLYYKSLNRWFGGISRIMFPAWLKWTLISAFSIGLLIFSIGASIVLKYRVKSKTSELSVKNRELENEISDRRKAEEARVRMLKRRQKLNQLQQFLLGSGSFGDKMNSITENIIEMLSADFCRIWVIKPGDICDAGCIHAKVTKGPHICHYRDRCLHLVASSGRYTHLDGNHRRVPFGCYKIGRIASEEANKFLTNDVINDTHIHDHEWAGKIGLLSFAGYQLQDPDRKPLGVLALFSKYKISLEDDALLEGISNITAQVIQSWHINDALQKQKNKLQIYLDTSAVMVVILNPDQRVNLINKKGCEILGYREEEIIGKNWFDKFLPERLRESVKPAFSKLMAGEIKPVEYYENEVLTRSGEERLIAWYNTVLRDEKGNIVATLSSGGDITGHKQAEKALKESELKFRTLINQASDSIFVLSPDKNGLIILDVNDAALTMHGYKRDELLGKSIEVLDDPESSEKLPARTERLMSGQPLSFEVRHVRKDSSTFPVEVSAQLIHINGQPFVLAIDRDITERKKAEKESKRLNMELEAKNKELEQMISVISHDLRSPIVNIHGYSQDMEISAKELNSALQRKDVPKDIKEKVDSVVNEDMSESAKYISTSIHKMDSLLSGLLKLSRTGPVELEKEKLDMKGLVSNIADNFEFQAKKAGANIKISKLPPCTGDRSQIDQVFSNLIGNALKYLDPERPGIISISGEKVKKLIVYCVEDNGVGIAPENQEKIFGIFKQLDKESSGEGLGLAIVKRIVERHSGRIRVESEPGKGSRFFISLPV